MVGGGWLQSYKVVRFKDVRMQSSRLQGYEARRLRGFGCKVQGFKAVRFGWYKAINLRGFKATKLRSFNIHGCEAATVIRASFGTVSASNKNKLFTLGPEDPDSILIREICHSTQKKECLLLLWDRTHLIPLRIAKTLNSLKNNDNSVPYLCYRIRVMKKIWTHQNPCENDSDVCLYTC